MRRLRKNVTLVALPREGGTTFKLLGPTGAEVSSFAAFAESLQNAPPNTRKKYCAYVADFFDFYFEAVCHLTVMAGRDEISRGHLLDIIDAWGDYLLRGNTADAELPRIVAQTLPPRLVKPATVDNKRAALSAYLRLSERFRRESNELANLNAVTGIIDPEPLLHELSHLRLIGLDERAKMLRTSVHAASTTYGISTRKQALFQSLVGLSPTKELDPDRAFPLDKFSDFVDVLTSYRDKALYCLYAATGCRASEGLQLLWNDIDIPKGTIALHSPFTRIHRPSYASLTPQERERLAWKGRQTSRTFLIEPFASMFFENLERYYLDEYIPHGRDQFVFQIARRPEHGRPYFATDPSTRQDVFDNAVSKIGVPYLAGPHSLRHAYGTYMVNYLPRLNGEFGLPIGLVRIAMGHSSITSTEKYAVLDNDLILADLEFANLMVFHKGETKGQLDFKIKAYEAQIRKLQELEATYK